MPPRVVVVGLASDFGCQVQMTNIEDQLLDVLGRIELSYWQLASSGHMPEEYDVAIVEGAVTTGEHVALLERIRATASAVIAIGACAVTGGIPALATSGSLDDHYACVYGEGDVEVACGRIAPMPITSVIDVEYRVPGCPIDMDEFTQVLSRALQGLSDCIPREPMCAICKTLENICFYERGEVCLGLITRTGCNARCITLGRPCTGCRGLAEDANLESAILLLAERGVSREDLMTRARLYNTLEEAFTR
ncbi:MAG: NADH:ubiquinone oxidoreductase [Actinobacteria bacterium]|nr:NADH:ubiquinone oxidoreductase [Actinomycetota bacterium]MCG2806722.1 NADH:ubiquinone oxidoreductase [Coriobacteriia bacterium]